MIPKIVHFCWMSKDPYPKKIRKCMKSWKKFLPDYEFVHWNFDRFPRGKSEWVDQAFDTGRFAFAADYIRLYALYNFGGIYLDTDVEVLKPFDDLLDLPYFIGQENTPSGIEAATLGCEKGNSLIAEMLKLYEGKSFVNADGSMNTEPLPFIMRRCIEQNFSYSPISTKGEFCFKPEVINIFPVDWFSPKHWKTQILQVSKNTYSIHHFTGSWLPKREKFLNWAEVHWGPKGRFWADYFWRPFPVVVRALVVALLRKVKRVLHIG